MSACRNSNHALPMCDHVGTSQQPSDSLPDDDRRQSTDQPITSILHIRKPWSSDFTKSGTFAISTKDQVNLREVLIKHSCDGSIPRAAQDSLHNHPHSHRGHQKGQLLRPFLVNGNHDRTKTMYQRPGGTERSAGLNQSRDALIKTKYTSPEHDRYRNTSG